MPKEFGVDWQGRPVTCSCCGAHMVEVDATALVEEKNRLVREVAELKAKLLTAAERIAAQSELLSNRAEKQGADHGASVVH